jgi:hypothetical protein
LEAGFGQDQVYEVLELQKIIGVQHKVRAAAPTGAMGKGHSAALRAQDNCKPTWGC